MAYQDSLGVFDGVGDLATARERAMEVEKKFKTDDWQKEYTTEGPLTSPQPSPWPICSSLVCLRGEPAPWGRHVFPQDPVPALRVDT